MFFSELKNKIKNIFLVSGYSRTANELLKLSDAQLSDIGISRELLKRGVKAYPWREELVSYNMPANLTHLKTSRVAAHTPIMPTTQKAA